MAFKKITDEDRAALATEGAALTKKHEQIGSAIDLLSGEVYHRLSEKEQSFLINCRSRNGMFLPLSAAQEKWLFDLKAMHEPSAEQGSAPADDEASPQP